MWKLLGIDPTFYLYTLFFHILSGIKLYSHMNFLQSLSLHVNRDDNGRVDGLKFGLFYT